MTDQQDPIETVVRRVAEGLGWPITQEGGWMDSGSIQINGYYLWPDREHDRIILAAYAKAECARRGYIPVRFEHPDRLSMRHRDHMGKTDPNLYDPEDPVSESEAILRAADDVVGNKDCRG